MTDLRHTLRALGLVGQTVCVHSSLGSLGHLEGGAGAFVDAFLLEGCTLLVPSFTWSFFAPPLAGRRPLRNAFDYARGFDGTVSQAVYTPTTCEIDVSMGAIPRAVVERPDRARGGHALCSFAAVGPDAHALVERQTPLDVYAPLQALADRAGFVLLVGVGLRTMTLLHLAEAEAGRTLFRRWAKDETGAVVEAATGGCSAGFDGLEDVLAPLARESNLGGSRLCAYPAREALAAAARAIRATPEITRCADPKCELCRDAVAGGPIV